MVSIGRDTLTYVLDSLPNLTSPKEYAVAHESTNLSGQTKTSERLTAMFPTTEAQVYVDVSQGSP
jgi:hypothetical protein